MILSEAQYKVFAERVKAKTDGANIHRVIGLLALVGDFSRHASNAKTRGDESDAKRCETIVDDMLQQIAKSTGVHP